MCEPVTIGLMVASTAASAYAAKSEADAKASALRGQAEAERAQGADALQRGAAEAGRTRTEASLMIGEAKAAGAAGGVDVQSGTAVESLASIRQGSELDVATIRANAARRAWGHEAQARTYEAEARNVEEQGKLAVAGTFLGGAARIGQYKAGRR